MDPTAWDLVRELRHGGHDLAPDRRSSIVAGKRQFVCSNGAFLERSLAIALDHELCCPPNVDVRDQSAKLMKSPPGPPMTLGNAAAARVRLIVWCKACGHQVEPDPAHMARRYGAGTGVLDWRDRLLCSGCGEPSGRYSGHRDRTAIALQATSGPSTGAADQCAALALAYVLRVSAVSQAVARVAHQATSPECRAAP